MEVHDSTEARNTRIGFHLPVDQLTGYPKKEFLVQSRGDDNEAGVLRLELDADVTAGEPKLLISLSPGTWQISEAMLLRAVEVMRACRFYNAGREA